MQNHKNNFTLARLITVITQDAIYSGRGNNLCGMQTLIVTSKRVESFFFFFYRKQNFY